MKSTSLWWPAMDSPVQDHLSTTLFLQCNPLPFICKSTPTRPLSIPVLPCFMLKPFLPPQNGCAASIAIKAAMLFRAT